MLQIVTKQYFRDGVPLHSTVQRRALYTNLSFLRGTTVPLPIGELAPSTGYAPVSSVTVSITEHLEAVELDGEPAGLVATGGTELVDDLADVMSFALNAVFSRDHDLVRRLVPASPSEPPRGSAASLFRDTFDASRFIPDDQLDDLRRFMDRLLALRRPHYEAAMRAIRRVVRAVQHAVDDPTVAYVDLVAALESLSNEGQSPPVPWSALDRTKRKPIDRVLRSADPQLACQVRAAVLEGERAGIKRRFTAFVMAAVSPAFFRQDAVGALRAMRGAQLERAVKLAYDVRSQNVHTLENLPDEAWVLSDRADTVEPPGMGVMFSLEGLARLSRHVIRHYIEQAPTGVDPGFDWRAALPGRVRFPLAPQYWVWKVDGFNHQSAPRYFSGFVSHAVEVLARREEAFTDMRAVLERIEQLLPGTAPGTAKASMVGIYALWNRILVPAEHRPRAAEVLASCEPQLQTPQIVAFATGLLTNQLPEWSADEWSQLARARRTERSQRRYLELPSGIDAALALMAAERLQEAGDLPQAVEFAGFAIEEIPGYEPLMTWEEALLDGRSHSIDMRALVLGVPPEDDQGTDGDGDDDAGSATSGDAAPDNGEPDPERYGHGRDGHEPKDDGLKLPSGNGAPPSETDRAPDQDVGDRDEGQPAP